jgi:16S rRNA (guanine1207-N2)-methyltransferase
VTRESAVSPVERHVAAYVCEHASNARLIMLHAEARVVFAEALRRGAPHPVLALHRSLPVVQTLQRDADVLGSGDASVVHAHGIVGLPPQSRADLVIVRLPTDKLGAHQLLRDAAMLLQEGGRCVLLGGTNEGIKSVGATMEQLFGTVQVLAHGGGHRVLLASRTPGLDEQVLAQLASPFNDPAHFARHQQILRGARVDWCTRPGVFSWDHLDEATELLAETMQVDAGESVLDLGCGAGILGAVAGRLSGGGPVTLVDADSEAVRCADRTMADSGVANWRVLASDVASAVRDESFDVVVSNPPFHTGKVTDLALPIRFIEQAHGVLRTGGRVQLVANRTLPYERELERVFGNRRTMHDGARFKVLEAIRR